MFDYQAGEKFKLTLMMVGFAGLMAGMFFTMLLMPSTEPPHRHKKAPVTTDTGGRNARGAYSAAQAAGGAAVGAAGEQAALPATPQGPVTDPAQATNFLENWLLAAMDLNAATAKISQEKAILYMTSECATAYRQSIWTEALSKQIEEAGLQSSFQAKKVAASQTQADGSVVIFVEGEQTLQAPGKPVQSRPTKFEYLVRNTPEGLRIAGITQGSG